ncbi:MAG: V4R domain-containing protein [Candidatus Jordarchaeaceae archaeon]
MEIISSGNQEIDDLSGGGFLRNSSVLFLVEAGSMGEIVALNLFTNRLSLGDTGFIIDFDIPPSRIREWFKFKKSNIEDLEKNKRFFMIDGFTRMYGETPSEEEYVIEKPRDIVHTNAYLVELSKVIEQYKPNVCILVLSNNLFLLRKRQLDKIINFIYNVRTRLSQFGLCIFVFDKGMLEERDQKTLEHMFDYVLDIKVLEVDRKFQKYLRVAKSPSPSYRDDFVPYEIRPTGFALSTKTVEDFDYINQQLKMLDEGVLEFLGSRVIIQDSKFYPIVFEMMMGEFGYEEASKFMYNHGKIGLPLVKDFREQFKVINLKKTAESFAKLTELWGQGAAEVTFDEKTNSYRFRVENSPFCSYFKGLGMVAGWLRAGLMAGAFESYTGNRYECREVKCVAKGDDYCEFIVKPSRV